MGNKIIEYTHEDECVDKYMDLLRQLYNSDLRINNHVLETKKLLYHENPFFNYATIKNFIVAKNDIIIAHASAIIDKRNLGVGMIGFFDCIHDIKVSNMLLHSAIEYLKQNGCKIIRGPINLSIWHDYRFIETLKRKPTIFDPFNKEYYIDFWKDYGFKIAEKYVSAVRSDFNFVFPYTKNAYEENLKKGFKIREFSKKNSKEDLKIIYGLSKQIFEESWNQVDISFEEFFFIYEPFIDKINPYFFEIIETNVSKPVAFSFAIPNPLIKNQLILKTMGVLKEYQRQKLAATFMYSQHLKAKERGFTECYYPLIRRSNNIEKFPYQGYEIITNYVSFELSLK